MVLENKLNLTSQIELNKAEEKISKQKAKQFFESAKINSVEVGTFTGLAQIHHCLFEAIYSFAGQIRDVNIAKGNFRFAPVIYLKQALESIDTMSQSNFEAIVEKYVEINIARKGNGRAARLWLDLILKKNRKSCGLESG